MKEWIDNTLSALLIVMAAYVILFAVGFLFGWSPSTGDTALLLTWAIIRGEIKGANKSSAEGM